MSSPASTPELRIEFTPATRWPSGLRIVLGAALLPLPWLTPPAWGLVALLAGWAGLGVAAWMAHRAPVPCALRLRVDADAKAPGAALVQAVTLGRAVFLRSRAQSLALWPDQLSVAQSARLRAWLKQHGPRHPLRLELQ